VIHRRVLLQSTVALLTMSAGAAAQTVDRPVRIGLIVTTPALKEAFIGALRDAGYVEGQNAVIIHRRLGDDAVREVLAQHADVICAASPHAIRSARNSTTTVPIIGVDLESDPLASGFVKTLARPGGNITGFFLDLPELGGKLMQLLGALVINVKTAKALNLTPPPSLLLRADRIIE